MRRRLASILLGCTLAVACTVVDEGSENQTMQTLKHPHGFSVRFNGSTFSPEQTDRGYRFLPVNAAEQRSPQSVDLTLERDAQPAGSWPESRDLDGRRVRYRIEHRPGGSAGDLFVLTAWIECSAHHLMVRQESQAETSTEADFTSAWSILSGATCPS